MIELKTLYDIVEAKMLHSSNSVLYDYNYDDEKMIQISKIDISDSKEKEKFIKLLEEMKFEIIKENNSSLNDNDVIYIMTNERFANVSEELNKKIDQIIEKYLLKDFLDEYKKLYEFCLKDDDLLEEDKVVEIRGEKITKEKAIDIFRKFENFCIKKGWCKEGHFCIDFSIKNDFYSEDELNQIEEISEDELNQIEEIMIQKLVNNIKIKKNQNTEISPSDISQAATNDTQKRK